MIAARDEYRQLLSLRPEERSAWLSEHYPRTPSAQWWLRQIEGVETDLKESRTGAALHHPLQFAVSWLSYGVQIGAIRQQHVISRLCRLSSFVASLGISDDLVPLELGPDALARRLLSTAGLSRGEALAAAARRRRELLENEDAWAKPRGRASSALEPDEEIDRLQELEWLLEDLAPLIDRIRDQALAAEVREWLALREGLALGADVVQRGRDLLVQWSEEPNTEQG